MRISKNIKCLIIVLIICIITYLIFLIITMSYNKGQNTLLNLNEPIKNYDTMEMNMKNDIDRQYLVDEEPELLPANEIIKRNYKGWMNEPGKDEMNEELYTDDVPLFDLRGPINMVPLDLNGEHRRVNFY